MQLRKGGRRPGPPPSVAEVGERVRLALTADPLLRAALERAAPPAAPAVLVTWSHRQQTYIVGLELDGPTLAGSWPPN